jgi:hypothetical protein
MGRFTGFVYQPESHLLDLVPELYCLEYVMALMAAPMLEAELKKQAGEEWIFSPVTGEILKSWWREGHRYDLEGFMPAMGMESLSGDALLERWKAVLGE